MVGRALSTWIYRIATNAASDELRRRGGDRYSTVMRTPITSSPTAQPSGEGAVDVSGRRSTQRFNDRPSTSASVRVALRDHLDLEYADIAVILGGAPAP